MDFLFEGIKYFIFVVIFTTVLGLGRTSSSFRIVQQLEEVFINAENHDSGFLDITRMDDFWGWAEDKMIPGFFDTTELSYTQVRHTILLLSPRGCLPLPLPAPCCCCPTPLLCCWPAPLLSLFLTRGTYLTRGAQAPHFVAWNGTQNVSTAPNSRYSDADLTKVHGSLLWIPPPPPAACVLIP